MADKEIKELQEAARRVDDARAYLHIEEKEA